MPFDSNSGSTPPDSPPTKPDISLVSATLTDSEQQQLRQQAQALDEQAKQAFAHLRKKPAR
jgi:hypothetical protein